MPCPIDSALPGADLVAQGVDDLAAGRVSVSALLVSLAASRLRDAGIAVPAAIPDADRGLYRLLEQDLGDGAHSRYNALRRRLLSFLRTHACASQ